MGSSTYRIDSGFLDDFYGNGTITPSRRRHNTGYEVTFADASIDPATVDMVKDHYKINHSNDDTEIERNIKTAFNNIESYTGRCIVQREVTVRYKRVTTNIVLPYPPHVSISSVKTIDDEGNEDTLVLNSDYYVIGEKEIILQPEATWEDQVEVVYTAGYGTTLGDIPTPLQDAVVYQMGILYSNFEESMGTAVYDRGVKMDERAVAASREFIYYASN